MPEDRIAEMKEALTQEVATFTRGVFRVYDVHPDELRELVGIIVDAGKRLIIEKCEDDKPRQHVLHWTSKEDDDERKEKQGGQASPEDHGGSAG